MEGRAEENVAGNRLPFLLAQRAASEGPRWTRAVKGNPVTRFEGRRNRKCDGWVLLTAPRVRTVKRCSLDGRSEEHHSHPPPSAVG